MHLAMIACLVWFGWMAGLGLIYKIGVLVVWLFLVYEHSLVSPNDFSRVNTAFFTMNGTVSIALFLFTAADLVLR